MQAENISDRFRYKKNERDGITITGYIRRVAALAVPAAISGLPVTAIGEDVFDDCTGLMSVTIPPSVTEIGDWAFWRCTSLTSVTIPASGV
jgi:hypothetical protein